jgi:hypothetical protein
MLGTLSKESLFSLPVEVEVPETSWTGVVIMEVATSEVRTCLHTHTRTHARVCFYLVHSL